MLRCLLITGLLAAGCKGKAKGTAAANGSAGSAGSAAYVPKAPPSRESAAAAKQRAALFAKVSKAASDANGDCDKLGPALAALGDEAAAAHDAKDSLLDADRSTDAKLEAATVKPLLGGTAQCKDTSKVDAFMRTLEGGEARGSASDAGR